MVDTLVLSFALVGLTVSLYIFYKKRRSEKLVCFLGEDCNRVVYSKYNKLFFGIPNEVIGIFYYLFIVGVLLIGNFPAAILLLISGVAAFFSLALLAIQLGILKEWCEYCLLSTAMSIAIFALLLR